MKRLLTRTARAHAAERLTQGSALVCRRRTAGILRWIRAGRRTDLTGWRAALGPIARLALVGLLAWIAYSIVRAVPWLLGLLVALWCHAAWKASRGPERPASEATVTLPPGEPMRALLLDLMGNDSAVHLSTVLDHLQQRPDTAPLTASWQVSDLRSRLESLGIPVHPKVKAGRRGPTRGVRRADLAPSPAEAPGTSPNPSTGV